MQLIIINSKDQLPYGWLSSPADIQIVTENLADSGITVKSVELNSRSQLGKYLDTLPEDALVLPNTYYINEGPGQLYWLGTYLEERQVPHIGAGHKTLEMVLQKDQCQQFMEKAGIPIPANTSITRDQLGDLVSLIELQISSYPVVLKPTKEFGSVGVELAHTPEEAMSHAKQILADFPNSDLIAEAFLPSDDITCGFIQLGDATLLLPTAYIVKSLPGHSHILNRKARLRSWDDVDKLQPVVTDAAILDQLRLWIPKITAALAIKDVTRIDGRTTADGQLQFFDVNGFPALCYPDGVIVKQIFSCFPDYEKADCFRALLHTILYNASLRHGLEVPESLKSLNLFTMESAYSIRLEEKQVAQP